jgi:hypothetical protein
MEVSKEENGKNGKRSTLEMLIEIGRLMPIAKIFYTRWFGCT